MVSPPPQTPTASLSPRPSRTIQEISGTLIDESDQINLVPLPTVSYPWGFLSDLELKGIQLQSQDWKTLIEAFEFTVLRCLEFNCSNFAQDQLQILVDCIPEESNRPMPLHIGLICTWISEFAETLRLTAALMEKAPHVIIDHLFN
ncbi:hypothetical protein BC939DRAFT_472367 [Gamsiella multidivaricata]|uniref:uncharacterized protein n=1 Tax=Gamsiella multidivaricata TaxID=101098 RepID=UPI002220D6C8|nr:uncharacterized protein BC939DRAFT_472367 [Gamsiella multidivaricata]KAI7832788.1 hypothetical protein BC939DRAFT_472367 [Gamsiella multidivaricata]